MYLTALVLTFKSTHIIGGDYTRQAARPRQIFPLKNETVWGPFRPTQMESINNCLFFPNMISLFTFAICVTFDVCDKGNICACVCEYVHLSRDSLLWFVVYCRYHGNVFLIASKPYYTTAPLLPQTGRSQITGQLLCGCEHVRREEYKWTDETMYEDGGKEFFHPLISEAAGVLLSGLGGQRCDMNVWFRRPLLCCLSSGIF